MSATSDPDIPAVHAYIDDLARFGMRFGLDSITELLAALGSPQQRYETVHIAGTNGKGSVAAMLAAMLRAAGYRVGCYTSPHLVARNERISVNGAPIANEALRRAATAVITAVETLQREQPDWTVTQFEFLTALAFYYFAQKETAVDISVVEVGLGGRLDATNIVAPAAVGLTAIARDHTAVLGDDIASIAAEKFAIVKSAAPVVATRYDPSLMSALNARCARYGAPLWRLGEELLVAPAGLAVDWRRGVQHVHIITPRAAYRTVELPLLGTYQQQNAALAVGLFDALDVVTPQEREDVVRAGLQRTVWPGRFHLVEHDPALILDCAHNPAAARALAHTLLAARDGGLVDGDRSGRIVVVLGILADKDIDGIVHPLLRSADAIVLTRSESSRAAAVDTLEKRVRNVAEAEGRAPTIERAPDVASAVDRARALAHAHDIVCVTGSCTVVGEALVALGQHRPPNL